MSAAAACADEPERKQIIASTHSTEHEISLQAEKVGKFWRGQLAEFLSAPRLGGAGYI